MEGIKIRFLTLIIIIFLSLVGVQISNVTAWGYTVHSEIAENAIDLLPEPWKTELAFYLDNIREASVFADQRKSNDPAESGRHYDDQDEPHQDRNVPYPSNNWSLGVVGWAAENASRDLTQAMIDNDFSQIIRYLGDTAHYISDAAQPFHATINYDGQLTSNHGIHSRFETQVIIRNAQDAFNLTDFGDLQIIDDVYNLTENQIHSGLALVDDVLAADNNALNVSETYTDEYYDLLYEYTRDIIKDRLKLAIKNVASVWYTSIIASNWTEFEEPIENTSTTSSITSTLFSESSTSQLEYKIFSFLLLVLTQVRIKNKSTK